METTFNDRASDGDYERITADLETGEEAPA